ncbi:DUF1403 family protein [Gellertiella hungarica]|uniref:DUF1403 family protein n=1 Tax=Gellertiella hungarica TaxID=1572859 RepID=A0A7W6J863_9HYPH|nr:DUF1403 family protein [Gellertiella hungarica]MBB4066596.1 hypothetical protein [Gellertiella hungarica]
MDSLPLKAGPEASPVALVPEWATRPGASPSEADAAFGAGAALAVLDGIVRSQPEWSGVWQARLALAAAQETLTFFRRQQSAEALRDALLLTPPQGDPGPDGHVLRAWQALSERRAAIATPLLRDLAADFGIRFDGILLDIPALLDDLEQAAGSPLHSAAVLLETIARDRPDAEPLGLWLADWMIARRLRWPRPLPLIMTQRSGPPFRTAGGRGRCKPAEPGYRAALCAAVALAAADACRRAAELSRRAAQLQDVSRKVRTKGAAKVIRLLLERDAVLATAPGTGLSRWAAGRLFERLESLGAVRELSGRNSFRIYGL